MGTGVTTYGAEALKVFPGLAWMRQGREMGDCHHLRLGVVGRHLAGVFTRHLVDVGARDLAGAVTGHLVGVFDRYLVGVVAHHLAGIVTGHLVGVVTHHFIGVVTCHLRHSLLLLLLLWLRLLMELKWER